MTTHPLTDLARDAVARMPRPQLLGTAAVLVLCVSLLDFFNGPEIAFSIFYLIPIILVARFANESDAVATAALSTIAWLTVDALHARHSATAVHLWDSAARLVFFLIVAWLLSRLVATKREQRRLIQFLARDLRGPLTNVLRTLDALERGGVCVLEREQRELLNVARASARRMLPLVHALVDLDRLAKGRPSLTLEDVCVEDMLQSAFDEIGLWAWERGIEVRHDVATDVSSVYVDRELTIRVLVNVLSDAIKRCPAQARIAVRATRIGPDQLSFTVESRYASGSPSELPADPGAIRDGKLSLDFCTQALDAQGGRFDATDVVPGYCSVRFTLPAGGVTGSDVVATSARARRASSPITRLAGRRRRADMPEASAGPTRR